MGGSLSIGLGWLGACVHVQPERRRALPARVPATRPSCRDRAGPPAAPAEHSPRLPWTSSSTGRSGSVPVRPARILSLPGAVAAPGLQRDPRTATRQRPSRGLVSSPRREQGKVCGQLPGRQGPPRPAPPPRKHGCARPAPPASRTWPHAPGHGAPLRHQVPAPGPEAVGWRTPPTAPFPVLARAAGAHPTGDSQPLTTPPPGSRTPALRRPPGLRDVPGPSAALGGSWRGWGARRRLPESLLGVARCPAGPAFPKWAETLTKISAEWPG